MRCEDYCRYGNARHGKERHEGGREGRSEAGGQEAEGALCAKEWVVITELAIIVKPCLLNGFVWWQKTMTQVTGIPLYHYMTWAVSHVYTVPTMCT